MKNAQTEMQIRLSGKDSRSNWEFQKIIVVLQEKNTGEVENAEKTEQEAYSVEPVQIAPVTWEQEEMVHPDQPENIPEKQKQELAAQISTELGVDTSCVEVRIDGDV